MARDRRCEDESVRLAGLRICGARTLLFALCFALLPPAIVESSCVKVLVLGCRLRGGSDASFRQRIPDSSPLAEFVNPKKGKKSAEKAQQTSPLHTVVTSTEAEQLREMGILKGKWVAESEDEPSSDRQDADPNDWPEEWAGLEEEGDVIKKCPGPIRLYKHTKYNRDLLPTGRLDPETLARLAPSLTDENGYSQVIIEDESNPDMPHDPAAGAGLGTARRQSPGDSSPPPPSPPPPPPRPTHLAHLPPGVSPQQAEQWLNEAIRFQAPPSERLNRGDLIPDLDFDGPSKTKQRMDAEQRLDKAVNDNDERGIERALEDLRRLDDEGL